MPARWCEARPRKTSTGDGESAPILPTQISKVAAMTVFTKLDQIRKHLRLDQAQDEKPETAPSPKPVSGKRVQKNLSILEHDAQRLAEMAKRDGVSQAVLLGRALDTYKRNSDARESGSPSGE